MYTFQIIYIRRNCKSFVLSMERGTMRRGKSGLIRFRRWQIERFKHVKFERLFKLGAARRIETFSTFSAWKIRIPHDNRNVHITERINYIFRVGVVLLALRIICTSTTEAGREFICTHPFLTP